MNRYTKIILITGFILTVYGYLCRAAGLYFFWESKYIGWIVIFIGIISFLFTRIRLKKAEKKKTLLEKIIIGILIFVLVVQTILATVIPMSDAYKAAKEYLLNNEALKAETGNIKGFSIAPVGSIQQNTSDNKTVGSATILLTIKGEKKFKDVTVSVEKKADREWVVVGVE